MDGMEKSRPARARDGGSAAGGCMSALEYKPPFELWKTDHGIDGKDAKRWLVARFTSRANAIAYLKARVFTYQRDGWFWHADERHRHTMGAISYEIRAVEPRVPIDPE
jgi:hypothetical protein